MSYELVPAESIASNLNSNFWEVTYRKRFTRFLLPSKKDLKKLALLIVCLAIYCYCVLAIILNIKEYLKYQVITNFADIYENQPEFPQVIIQSAESNWLRCHFNNEACSMQDFQNGFLYFNRIALNRTGHQTTTLKSKQVGIDYGLKLGLTTKNVLNGVTVFITNQSSTNTDKSIKISAGMRTNLAIKRVFEERLGPPYTSCQKDIELKTTLKKLTYLQSNCFITCKNQMIAETCGFTEWIEQNHDTYFLDTETFMNKFNLKKFYCQLANASVINEINKKFAFEGENKLCENVCPSECSSHYFSIIPYYFMLPGKDYKNGYAELNIYYESFYHNLKIDSPKMTREQLVGTIGGLIGLLLGASILGMRCFCPAYFARVRTFRI